MEYDDFKGCFLLGLATGGVVLPSRTRGRRSSRKGNKRAEAELGAPVELGMAKEADASVNAVHKFFIWIHPDLPQSALTWQAG